MRKQSREAADKEPERQGRKIIYVRPEIHQQLKIKAAEMKMSIGDALAALLDIAYKGGDHNDNSG